MDYLQFSECVNLVENNLKIDEVVARYAHLRKAGEYYRCRCLFHDDDGESLIVNPEAGIFYCPVCHAGGNALKFFAMAEKASLFEVIENQAKIFNVDLHPKKVDFNVVRFEAKKRELAEINEYAGNFYNDVLKVTNEGAFCRKYLESRGISKFAVEKFNIGFASEDSTELIRFLYEYNFNVGTILESGLISRKENLFEDKFKDCMIFPFSDPYGKITTLIGRVFDFEKKVFDESAEVTSKYIFPDENAVFNVKNIIFGLNAIQTNSYAKDTVIIVEDCLDAVILSSAGIKNVVAIPKNNLTVEIAKSLTKYASRIIFCIKNGDKLQLEEDSLKAVANASGTVFIATLPENPVEYLNKEGKDAFFEFIKNPICFDEYEFSKRNVSENITHIEVKDKVPVATHVVNTSENRSNKYLGVMLLKLACFDSDFLNYVTKILTPEIFDYEPHKEIFRYINICYDENSAPNKEEAMEFLDKNSYKEFLKILKDPEVIEEIRRTPADVIVYLGSDEINIRMAAEDAAEKLLNKMSNTDYLNNWSHEIRNYEEAKKILNHLHDIKQTEGK